MSVLLGPRLKRTLAKLQQRRSEDASSSTSDVIGDDEEPTSDVTSDGPGSSSGVGVVCYRLDSGNSLDSGLECSCSSSVGSMESESSSRPAS